MRATVLAAILWLATTAGSQAAVIFNWATTGGRSFDATLVITDEAYASGHLSREIQYYQGEPYCGSATPCDDFGGLISISVSSGPGLSFDSIGQLAGDIGFDLYIESGELTGGYIRGQNTTASFGFNSYFVDWVGDFNNEQGECYNSGQCEGAGYWQRASNPGGVPEPFSAALLLVGLSGALAFRRSQRTAASEH